MRVKLNAGLALALLAFSCASGPVDIPADMGAAKMIQEAQEASERGRYDTALQYYRTITDRFSEQIDLVVSAEYEIAFTHYKQKKYAEASAELQALLDRYKVVDSEFLPPQYKILAEKVLSRIEALESTKPAGS